MLEVNFVVIQKKKPNLFTWRWNCAEEEEEKEENQDHICWSSKNKVKRVHFQNKFKLWLEQRKCKNGENK